jgi:hypothetical protein
MRSELLNFLVFFSNGIGKLKLINFMEMETDVSKDCGYSDSKADHQGSQIRALEKENAELKAGIENLLSQKLFYYNDSLQDMRNYGFRKALQNLSAILEKFKGK